MLSRAGVFGFGEVKKGVKVMLPSPLAFLES